MRWVGVRRAGWLALAASIVVFVWGERARADILPSLPGDALTLGASAAWDSGAGPSGDGLMLGADIAYVRGHYWASGGTRLVADANGVGAYYPYVEAGAWLVLNVGVGYSLGLAAGRAPWSNLHFFVGLPIPLSTEGTWLPFVEPYYRPMWDGDALSHEVGVLMKWAVLLEAED